LRIKKFLLGYFALAVLSGIALSVWRTVLMVRYYDPYSNEYALEASGSLKAIGFTMLILFIIFATSALAMIKFEFTAFSASDHQTSVFTSALLGFVFLAIGVFVSLNLKTILENYNFPYFRYAQIASYALLFLCAIYFILNATGNPRFAIVKKVLAVIPPIWGLAFLLASYIDPAYNYKDFNHTLCNVAICALTLFFFYDAKMAVLKKATGFYFVISLISLTASMVYMIPTFVLLAYWELPSGINYLFEAVLLGALFYTFACARSLCKNVKVREKPQPKQKEATEEAQN
jgi:hypothetical protein